VTTDCSRSETKPSFGLPATAPVFWLGSFVPQNPSDTNLLLHVVLSFYLFLCCSNFHLIVYPLAASHPPPYLLNFFCLFVTLLRNFPTTSWSCFLSLLSSLQLDRCSHHMFFSLDIFKTYKILNEGPKTATDGCLNPSYTRGAHLGSLGRYQKLFPSS